MNGIKSQLLVQVRPATGHAHQNHAIIAPNGCAYAQRKITMDMNSFFTDLQSKINSAIENSPAKDIEKNVKSMMTQGFSKLDLVTREEFDIQNQVLAKTRAKLEALELRLAALEEKLAANPGSADLGKH